MAAQLSRNLFNTFWPLDRRSNRFSVGVICSLTLVPMDFGLLPPVHPSNSSTKAKQSMPPLSLPPSTALHPPFSRRNFLRCQPNPQEKPYKP